MMETPRPSSEWGRLVSLAGDRVTRQRQLEFRRSRPAPVTSRDPGPPGGHQQDGERPWLATAICQRQGEACGAPAILLGCALSSRALPSSAVQRGDHDRGQRTRVARVFVLRGGEERERHCSPPGEVLGSMDPPILGPAMRRAQHGAVSPRGRSCRPERARSRRGGVGGGADAERSAPRGAADGQSDPSAGAGDGAW